MMTQPLRWLDIIYLSAALNGFIFALAIIFIKKGNRIARATISILLFFLAVDIAYRTFYSAEYHFQFPHLTRLESALSFSFGPLLYLYVKLYTDPKKPFKKSYIFHFTPFILYTLRFVPYYFQSSANKINYMKNPTPPAHLTENLIINIAKLLFIMIYLVFTLKYLNKYTKEIKNTFSTIEKINLLWIRFVIYGSFISAGFHFLLIILFKTLHIDFPLTPNEINQLLCCGAIYIIGISALIQPELFQHRYGIYSNKKYEKSTLPQDKIGKYLENILNYMKEEKPYMDSELTLYKLAEALSIHPHHLSQIINEQLNQNFFEFINKYRVEEAKEKLGDPEESSRTILDIAYDVGFNSKSTFNAIFKKYTHMTPSHFRSTHVC